MIGMIILVAFIIGLLAVLPFWPHSRGWGYRPLGIGLIFFVMFVVLLLIGRIPIGF
jgi:hypothetical protein